MTKVGSMDKESKPLWNKSEQHLNRLGIRLTAALIFGCFKSSGILSHKQHTPVQGRTKVGSMEKEIQTPCGVSLSSISNRLRIRLTAASTFGCFKSSGILSHKQHIHIASHHTSHTSHQEVKS